MWKMIFRKLFPGRRLIATKEYGIHFTDTNRYTYIIVEFMITIRGKRVYRVHAIEKYWWREHVNLRRETMYWVIRGCLPEDATRHDRPIVSKQNLVSFPGGKAS